MLKKWIWWLTLATRFQSLSFSLDHFQAIWVLQWGAKQMLCLTLIVPSANSVSLLKIAVPNRLIHAIHKNCIVYIFIQGVTGPHRQNDRDDRPCRKDHFLWRNMYSQTCRLWVLRRWRCSPVRVGIEYKATRYNYKWKIRWK